MGTKLRIVDKYNLFPIKDREALAYQLGESALLLLGTAWLSALSSTNLSRLQDVQTAVYLLRVLEPDQDRCDLIKRLKAYADSNLLDLQCWSLGVLLAEIKLGIKVVNIVDRERQVFLVLADESEISIDGAHLEMMCGPTYNAVITHCFNPKTTLSRYNIGEEEYHMMLWRFYRSVFIPLKDELNRSKARQGRIAAALR